MSGAEQPPLFTTITSPSGRLAAFVRFREVAGHVVVTNLEGELVILTRDEFRRFVEGRIEPGEPLYERLRERNMLRAHYDVRRAAEAWRARRFFLDAGPNLHIFVVTLRCNETCVYCHASRAPMDATHTDMTPEIAEKAVDLALRTTSPYVTIEFQGGEPLVNFPVVEHVVRYARERNRRAGKVLEFTMVTNLSCMDEERLRFLLDNRVQICTSVDGPAVLHDRQRKLPGGSAHAVTAQWIERINRAYVEMGLDPSLYHVEALLTTTRETLPLWKEVVDTYVALGCRTIFLRPVDPFGFAQRTSGRVEYPRAEYMAFYRKALDYILELNARGIEIMERYAAIFLTKMLRGQDPNFLDIRSPGGQAIGVLAYNYDGGIYTCDEGRMLHEMGDDTFRIGDVRTARYRDLFRHPTVRAVVLASNLDQNPDCVCCAYQPFCGLPPSHAHKTQGTMFGRPRESTLCYVHKHIQDVLIEKLAQGDATTRAIFERWTTIRPREHFLQS
ncbi:MAG: His-Xaa-Ser system radical SAM maturase HxsB [Myxococcota bacterium]|nr:His-Xaa-Ser system radical SAM maturase HxsB [Myxococcota bacterium]MDW8362292.1 His-Xaa-Ser system radical SAM maturase HxsB [Myxococcales bacterium]